MIEHKLKMHVLKIDPVCFRVQASDENASTLE